MRPHEESNVGNLQGEPVKAGKPRKPVHPKVVAGTLGAACAPFVIWLTGWLLFGGASSANHVQATLSAVPWPVSGVEVAALAAFGGWLKTAKDTDPA